MTVPLPQVRVLLPQPEMLRVTQHLSLFSLFVCQKLHVNATDLIFVNILPKMHLQTRKNSLNFEIHPLPDHEDPRTENNSTSSQCSFFTIANSDTPLPLSGYLNSL